MFPYTSQTTSEGRGLGGGGVAGGGRVGAFCQWPLEGSSESTVAPTPSPPVHTWIDGWMDGGSSLTLKDTGAREGP